MMGMPHDEAPPPPSAPQHVGSSSARSLWIGGLSSEVSDELLQCGGHVEDGALRDDEALIDVTSARQAPVHRSGCSGRPSSKILPTIYSSVNQQRTPARAYQTANTI